LNHPTVTTSPPRRVFFTQSSAWFLLAFAVLCWAGNMVMGRALRDQIPPVALTLARWLLAFAVLLPFAIRGLASKWHVLRRRWKLLLLLSACSSVLQHIPIYIGLRETTATNGTLLYATSPIFILLLSVVALGQRLRPIAAIGTVLSFAGVIVVVTRGDAHALLSLTLNPGDAWLLVSAFTWAAYTIALRSRPAELSGFELLTAVAGVSSIMLLPLWLIETAMGYVFVPTLAVLGGILYVSLVASVIAYIAYNRGVAIVGPARAAPFMYLMPIFTALLAVMLLGEDIRLYHLAGGFLIIAGVYLATSSKSNTSITSPEIP
jgi:drug/metabolite transporter (DMT)-like permease